VTSTTQYGFVVVEKMRLEEQMDGESKPPWTFLTNHAHVLVCIAEEPDIRGRDIASRVGITERAAQAIVADLVNEGYVTRTREGRRNHYAVNPDAPLRHPLEHDHSIGELLVTLGRLQPTRRRRSRRSA
jgi:predicted HTH transcriptional regulator